MILTCKSKQPSDASARIRQVCARFFLFSHVVGPIMLSASPSQLTVTFKYAANMQALFMTTALDYLRASLPRTYVTSPRVHATQLLRASRAYMPRRRCPCPVECSTKLLLVSLPVCSMMSLLVALSCAPAWFTLRLTRPAQMKHSSVRGELRG